MHSVRNILDATCMRLGYDRADREAIYLFHFCAESFQGYQVCLEKMRPMPDGGCAYGVHHSTIGDFKAKGIMPAAVNAGYFRGWPERIYFRLDTSTAGGIVS